MPRFSIFTAAAKLISTYKVRVKVRIRISTRWPNYPARPTSINLLNDRKHEVYGVLFNNSNPITNRNPKPSPTLTLTLILILTQDVYNTVPRELILANDTVRTPHLIILGQHTRNGVFPFRIIPIRQGLGLGLGHG